MTTPLAVAISGRGLVDPSEPVLRADDEGFTRGRAAFETMRVYGGVPFRFAQHVERLAGSARRLGIPEPDRDELAELARLVLDHAGLPDVALRLYLTPGPPGGPPHTIALVSVIPEWIESARQRGQRLRSLVYPRRDLPWLLPGTKSTSYAVHLAAESEARSRGDDDALFVDADGTVLEGPVTNVWWRESSLLLTPSLDLGILAGETRAALLELAPALGYRVEEGRYPLGRMLAADEVFTSSSVREVMPVIAVDEHELALGPAAAALQSALREQAST